METETYNDSYDYVSFSDNEEVQKIAKESLSHISKLYPIYILMNYHGGNQLEKEQIEYLDMLLDLVNQFDADITFVVNEQDIQMLKGYDSENSFKYIVHSCYDSNTDLTNNIPKIKNLVLKTAASRFGNKNIGWIFLIEEGVRFSHCSLQNKFVECKNAEELFLVFGIWQYLLTKSGYSFLKDENPIGVGGIVSDSDATSQKFTIDKTLISSAMLINLSECNRKHVEFDSINDVLEDIDFNINVISNGLHVVGISWPLNVAKTMNDKRSDKKISNLALNFWAKWGDKVVKSITVLNNKIKLIFVSDFSEILNEYNSSNRHRIIWPKNERLLVEYLEQKRKLHS